jgi:hypothetical protein
MEDQAQNHQNDKPTDSDVNASNASAATVAAILYVIAAATGTPPHTSLLATLYFPGSPLTRNLCLEFGEAGNSVQDWAVIFTMRT